MNKKLLKSLALTFALSTTLTTATACSFDSFINSINGLLGKQEVAFLEGYHDELTLGDALIVAHYIDKKATSDYTLTVSLGDKVVDLTKKATWSPDEPGNWKLVYTVGKKSVETIIKVKVPTITWQYTSMAVKYNIGDTLDFETAISDLNIAVESYYPYEVFIDSVLINGVSTDLKRETSFTFTSDNLYDFTFCALSEDGQKLSAKFYAIPDTDEPELYWEKGNSAMPISVVYANSYIYGRTIDPNLASDGVYSQKWEIFTDRHYDGFGLRSSVLKTAFADNSIAEYSFDVYNGMDQDYPYVFTRALTDPLGMTPDGTLKAKSWTTVTLTRKQYKDFLPFVNSSSHCIFEVWDSSGKASDTMTFRIDNFRAVAGEWTDAENDPNAEPITYYYKDDATSLINTFYINSATAINENANFASVGAYSNQWRFLTTRRSTAFGFRKGKDERQLNNVFKANNVEGYSFDIYNTGDKDVSYAFIADVINLSAEGASLTSQGVLKAGEWTTVTLSRELYEELAEIDSQYFVVFEVWIDEIPQTEFSMYLDNFRPVDADGETVDPDFTQEPETPDTDEPKTYFTANDSTSLINTFYINSATALNEDANFASVGTYSNKWRFLTTRRSTAFGFRKGNDEKQINNVFKATNVAGYSFDIYNTGDKDVSYAFVSSVLNLSDGVSTLTAQGALSAGEWTTVTLTRAQYEALVAENGAQFVAFEVWLDEIPQTEFSMYLDNFRSVDADGETVDPDFTQPPETPEVAEPKTYFTANDSTSLISTFYMNSATAINEDANFASIGTYSNKWRFLTGRRSTAFGFRKGNDAKQLNNVFSNPTVTAYSFDVYNASDKDVSYAFIADVINMSSAGANITAQGVLKAGEWTTVTLTREQYEELVALNSQYFIVFEVWLDETPTTEFAMYLDNFHAVTSNGKE